MTGEERAFIRQAISLAKRRQVPYSERRCSGCGTEYNLRTIGCRICNWRWAKRRGPSPRVCAGCGVEYDEHTSNCQTCRERRKWRRSRRKAPKRQAA